MNNINHVTLTHVLTKMLGADVTRADYQTKNLQGGTIGDVQLVTGVAETADGEKLPYKTIFKTHKKYERFGDSDSWRREYELYISDFSKAFTSSLRWPECYYAEINESEFQIWLEYIDGVSGSGLTIEMLEQAALELGRFQGLIYRQPELLHNTRGLGDVDYIERDFMGWHKQTFPYDYLITEQCRMPEHIKQIYRDNKDIINHEKTVEYNCLRFPECDLPDYLKKCSPMLMKTRKCYLTALSICRSYSAIGTFGLKTYSPQTVRLSLLIGIQLDGDI